MRIRAQDSLKAIWQTSPSFMSREERATYTSDLLGDESESPFVWESWDKDPGVRSFLALLSS